nr:hypothetical protein [Tanacetum cinerariifolium]
MDNKVYLVEHCTHKDAPMGIEVGLEKHLALMERSNKIPIRDRGRFGAWFANRMTNVEWDELVHIEMVETIAESEDCYDGLHLHGVRVVQDMHEADQRCELQELNALCIMIAHTQTVANSSDDEPSYDSDFVNEDVRYIPCLKRRLICVGQLDDEGYHVGFQDQQWKVTKGILEIARRKTWKLVPFDGINVAIDGKGNTTMWHQRLGHIREKGMKILPSFDRIPDLLKASVGFCGSSDTSEGSKNSRSFKDSGRSDEEDSEDGASFEEGGSKTPHVRRTNRESWASVRVKEEQNGSKTYKARLVVKGFQQKHGVDYSDIFFPVVKMTKIMLVLSIGFQSAGKEENLMCKFKKSLYRLKLRHGED